MERDIAWVQKLDQTFLECRTLRHSWDKVQVGVVPKDEISIKVDPSAQVITRVLQCRRCSTWRRDYYVRNDPGMLSRFFRHSSSYLYTKDYTFKGAEHEAASPKQNDYIMESFRRDQVI